MTGMLCSASRRVKFRVVVLFVQGPSKKMARQLAAAAVLERLVDQVGVHEIVGKQHRPEPKDPQVKSMSTLQPVEIHGILNDADLCPRPCQFWETLGSIKSPESVAPGTHALRT